MFKQSISFEVWGGESGKYRLRDQSGKALENTPEETCQRVAKALSDIEQSDNREFWYKKFINLIGTKFAGGGRIMANAGAMDHKKETSPINCTVMRQIPDSMEGIMQVAKEAALTLKAGCGVGYDFSTIRPKGANVFGAGAATSGIISFMKIFDAVCSTVMSGGGRRGAQMACLDVSSPEIEDFITAKRQDGVLRYFNCSVLITDSFMKAVESNGNWDLWYWEKDRKKKVDLDSKKIKIIKKNDIPYNHSSYNFFSFAADHNEVMFGNATTETLFTKKVYKTVKANDIFDLMMKSTYDFAEPGFILIDRANAENNLYFCETIRCTNPCFSGDTQIAVADGRNSVSIKQLAEEGKDVPVYSVDGNGKVSIKWGRNPRITGYEQKLLRITLDDGSYLDTTPNHSFILRDGTKIEAKDLKYGDSLPRFTKSLEPVKTDSKDYYRIYCNTINPQEDKIFEHRLIAKFYYPEKWDNIYQLSQKNGFAKTGGLVVHHKDYDQLNNTSDNLEIMTFKDHSKLHVEIDQAGEKSGRYLGITNAQIKEQALVLTERLGRRFSRREWQKFAKSIKYPSQFSQFRVDEFGVVENMAKNCAAELGYEYNDVDTRILETYKNILELGYAASIKNNEIVIKKVCEGCGSNFNIIYRYREVSFCSKSCGSKNRVRKDAEYDKTREFYKTKAIETKEQQLKTYSHLKFTLNREPFLKEWKQECKSNSVPCRIDKTMVNGFKSFEEVKEAGNKYNHKVSKVEELQGKHTVYNITVDENHTVGIITGTTEKRGNLSYSGVYVAQCGEQPLGPLASCLLGSMILPPYIQNPFEKDASFNFTALYDDVLIVSRALDNVVEINNLPLKEMQEEIKSKRRHGLGITGLGSALNMLGLKYGSEESIALAERVAFIIAEASLRANISLAKEKGCAPIFEGKAARESVIKSGYLARLLNELKDKEEIIIDIAKYGLRYSHATSIAPTGTMSLTWGNNCSNGIEPVFADSYMRNIREPGKKTKRQDEVMDYAFFLWKEKNKDKKLPGYWSTTEMLEVSDHIRIQAAMQKWCDSSISKTINVPVNYPFEDFKKVYMDGWKAGLKGITTFRFNPDAFSGVLVQKADLENTTYTFTGEDGREYSLKGSDQVEYDGETHNVANLFDALKEGMYGDM